MSHYKQTVASQNIDSSGNIALSLENLDGVSISSSSNNEVLAFNGTSFINTTKDESDIITGHLFATENSTVSGVSSTYDNTVNSKFMDTRLSTGYGREETLGGLASVSEFPSGTASAVNIYCQFQLASGQFLLIASTRGHFSSSTKSSNLCWMDGSYNKLGNQALILPPSGGMRGSKKIYGYINTNTNTKVHLGFVSTDGHLRRRSDRGYTVQIIKLGEYIS